MMRGMVERLAERLKRDGSDVEGWLRLVRAYMVLGDRDKAQAAASDARRALAGEPDKLRQLDELVKDSASKADRSVSRMTRKQRRLGADRAGLGVLALAAALVLTALKDSIVFFNSPTDMVEKQIAPGTRIRLGGLVKAGTHRARRRACRALRGDRRQEGDPGRASGHPAGPVPRGAGRDRRGRARRGRSFKADTILAKHDENYMPKEVADALKKTGHWKDETAKKTSAAPGGRTQ